MNLLSELCLIILNYNSYEDTVSCVQQLLSFDSPFQIIVVDNQSTDQSLSKLIERFALCEKVDVIVTDKNGGYSYGNNYGVRYAFEHYSPTYVSILNPDVIIPEEAVLLEMISKLNNDDSYALIGGATITEGIHFPKLSAWHIPNNVDVVWERSLLNKRNKNNYFEMIDTTLAQVDCVVGCFFIIKSAIFNEIGLFDENIFLYNEENILGIKLRQKGYVSLVSTNSFYYHNHDSEKDKNVSLAKKLKFLKIRYQSRKYLIEKYYSSILVFPLFIIEALNSVQITLGHCKRVVKEFSSSQS